MKTEKIILKLKNRRISVKAKVMRGINRAIGLMFSRKEKAEALLFRLNNPSRMAIHSFFVVFPFLAVWLDSDGKIMEIRRVKPFSAYVCPKKNFASLVEIPLNRKYKKITDGIEKFK